MTKAIILCGIIIYLFLSSFLISLTYVEVDEYWQPALITKLPVYHENFTATSNISDYNIEITKGGWIIENSQLVSTSLIKNEFIIQTVELEQPLIIYNVSNMEDKTRFYVYYRDTAALFIDTAYFEFDYDNDIINSAQYDGFWEKLEVVESKPFDFVKSDYIIETDCSIESGFWSFFTDDVVCTLTIDNINFTSVLFEDLSSTGLIRFGGIYTEGWDFRVNFVSAIETMKKTDILSLFDYVSIIAIIILFLPPEIVMPFWINFIFFKIPLVAVVWMGIETLRGTD